MDAEIGSSNLANRLYETQQEGQNLVMVAFDATVKQISHAGIVWAMEHALKQGDILTIVSVLDSVRGQLGQRVKIGDYKWLSANQKRMEEEIQQKTKVWESFPGLKNRCAEDGVKLAVLVTAAQRGELELAICKEAMKLRACHVVLDRSLKNRRREFYRQNISCNVTRMRRSGGVDMIRANLDMAMTKISKSEERSPTLWFPPPLLSYDDQIDEFEISWDVSKNKQLHSKTPKSAPKYSGELKSGELRRLPSSATAHEHSSQSTYGRRSSESSVNRPSFTSSSNDHDMDDDLFSIFHGDTEMDIDLFSNINLSSSGYESDNLFSIGNTSTSPAPSLKLHPLPLRHSHLHSSTTSSIPDTASRISTDTNLSS